MSDETGYIYIITNELYSEYVKVGYTDNVILEINKLKNDYSSYNYRLHAYYVVNRNISNDTLDIALKLINPIFGTSYRIGSESGFYRAKPEIIYSIFAAIAYFNKLDDNLHLIPEAPDEHRSINYPKTHKKPFIR